MAQDAITFFAKTNFRSENKKFGIKRVDRRQHMYVIGKTGVGKTALLKNMALQDVQNGEGVAIVDPHGEFVEEVLDGIPASRTNDVIYFNPADMDFPVGFNVLEVSDPKYKHLVASSLMSVFTKIWANVWSARMEYILHNCILALVDTPGTTLLGINRLLVDKDYRQRIINNLKDPVVKSFWVNEYAVWEPRFRNEAIAPIQNKVGQFLNTSLIRNIVGQSKSTLNIPEIMDAGKILLVNLAKGRVGEDNSALLGGILITKIQLATMERVRISEKERRDFYLYVDEFQNFVTDAFANVLSEARKFRLNLIIAHQYIGQLITETTTKVRDAIFGNVGTLIIFRVGAGDAEFLEQEFIPEFTILDLVNLPNYHIYLRLLIDGITSRPFSAGTLSPMEMSETTGSREKIINVSRERYAVPREIVEEKISRWSGVMDMAAAEAEVQPSPSGLYDAVCSVCKKPTKVVFKPDPSRPIYCKSCRRKMEKGTIVAPSARPSRPQPQRPQSIDHLPDLEKLGIGVGFKKEETSPSPTRARQETKEVERQAPPSISLQDAAKRGAQPFQKRKRERKEVDIKDLRETLKEAQQDN